MTRPLAALPRRLADVARLGAPTTLAHERRLPVGGELGAALPGGGLRRGSVTWVAGPGGDAVVLALLAAATGAGEWATVVDPDATFGGLAALEAGVTLERCVLVRSVPPARWATIVGALLEGMAIVVAPVPRHVRAGDARRLVARTRERQALLVVAGAWPAPASLRVRAGTSRWHGLGRGEGLLARRELTIDVEGSGAPRRELAREAG